MHWMLDVAWRLAHLGLDVDWIGILKNEAKMETGVFLWVLIL